MKSSYEQVIVCHECDALHLLQPLPAYAKAHCATCDAVMYQHVRPDTIRQCLALYVSALLLFIMANTLPFISLKLAGHVETDILLSGPLALFEMGMGDVGALVLLTSIIFPLFTMLAALYVLIPASLGLQARGLAPVFRIAQYLMPWSLLGVFMLAVLIAIVKLLDLAEIEVGIAFMAFAVLLPISVMAQQRFDSALFWPHQYINGLMDGKGEHHARAIIVLKRGMKAKVWPCHTCSLSVPVEFETGDIYCPRCGDHVHGRKPDSLARTWALLIAAIMLLVPANILPIMTVTQFGKAEPSTILSGVEHLIAAGMWHLGLIVFFASIMVPVSKLLTLVFLLLSVRMKSSWRPYDRTRLYRMTEMIGSWSMVDIFIIGILTSLVSLDALATIEPGPAASFFAASVVLTMLAAQSFDPRLIWDTCGDVAQDIERDKIGLEKTVKGSNKRGYLRDA